MKNAHFKFFLLSFVILVSGICNSLHAQKQSKIPTANFLMSVMTSEEIITISCIEGCEYDKLSIRLGDQVEAFNNKGATTLVNDLAMMTADALSPGYFLFTLERTDGGILLKGLHGTNWEKLSFEFVPKIHQAFNQDGLVH